MSFLIHNTWIWKTNIPDVFLNFISENSHSVTSTGQVKAQVRNNKLKMICIGPDLVFIFSKINELTPHGGPTKNCRKEREESMHFAHTGRYEDEHPGEASSKQHFFQFRYFLMKLLTLSPHFPIPWDD